MGKFKVGDKARLNCARAGFKAGDIVEVIETDFQDQVFPYLIKRENETGWTSGDSLEKVNTKKQRIKALEKRVEALEKLAEEYFKIPVEPSTDEIATIDGKKISAASIIAMATSEYTEQVKPTKSPNQLRAEIIKKAKGFVNKYLNNSNYGRGVVSGIYTPLTSRTGPLKYKFVVNVEKRTVVAIGELYHTGEIYDHYKGIAKCNPSDVFNEHIGKAIALGRALGLDVSEFERAVQPTEFAVGQVIHSKLPGQLKKIEVITEIRGDSAHINTGGFHFLHRAQQGNFKIINDTNAIYGEVE